jgi:hypothetical protein
LCANASKLARGIWLVVCSLSLTFEDPNERLGVSERVVDRMVIVLRPPQPLPSLCVSEVTDQSCVEVGNAPTRMPERILSEVAPEVEVDPMEIVRGIVRDEDDGPARFQPFTEPAERLSAPSRVR